MYLMVSGDPSLISISNISFEENKARKEESTLYVVWKSTLSITSNEFSPFVNANGDEAKMETLKGEIVTLAELLSGEGGGGGSSEEGGEGEGKNTFAVCAVVAMSGNVGKVVVIVDEDEEMSSGEGCVVGMEGEDVKGEVKMGEVGREGAVVEMGNELTNVLKQSEDITIVMNVSYGLSNG